MKFAFVTCVQIGLSCMEAIYESNGRLDLIITIPDSKSKKKSGRIYVDDFAKKHKIPVLKVNHINNEETIKALKGYNIDWMFIIGWSQIAAKNIIETPKLGTVGAHPTLLPIGRGRAAIPWAIIKGLDVTGVTFFKMDEGVDTGLILDQEEVPVLEEETATTLYDKVNSAHETLIQKLYDNLKNNNEKTYVQDENKATYWPGRKPEDGQILLSMTIEEVDRLVRGTTKPYPGAFIIIEKKKHIIWEGFKSNIRLKKETFLEIQLEDGYFYASNFELEVI